MIQLTLFDAPATPDALPLDPRLLARMAAHGWHPTGAAWYEAGRGFIREWTRGQPGDDAELPDYLIEEVTAKWC